MKVLVIDFIMDLNYSSSPHITHTPTNSPPVPGQVHYMVSALRFRVGWAHNNEWMNATQPLVSKHWQKHKIT